MKRAFLYSVLSLLLMTCLQVTGQVIRVNNLRCEGRINPAGIEAKEPRISWIIESQQRGVRQTDYQVLVASSRENLDRNEGDLWNSGKVNTASSIHIRYAGKPLTSGSACYWKVKVSTNKGASAWSTPAQFSIGLLDAADWKASWIGYDKASAWDSITQFSRLSARYFRKSFAAPAKVKKATAYIVGLGLYELYINGKKVGDQVLAPNPTDYRQSVFYNTHDVTSLLMQGDNAIGVVLGNGRFFTMRQDYKPKKINTFGYPKLLFQMEIVYTDGSTKRIVSDGSWKLHVDGPIRSNNEYDGEEYDATKELTGWYLPGYKDNNWLTPEMVQAPEGKVVAQINEPMKVKRVIRPVAISKLSGGRYIVDMGQNFAGWLQVKVKGNRGQQVQLRFAESLQSNGELYVANLRDAKVTDVYTLKGGAAETWHPSFVYHGFRYVELTGFPGEPRIADLEGQMVYDDLETVGSFVCSNPTINQVYRNAWWGIASNYKGMPVDCPQRNERQPWLGDRATGAYGESYLFNNGNLYAKWLDDIQQSQTAEGAIPDVAPAYWNYYSDNVTWPGVYILVARMLLQQYGDSQAVAKHYPSMKKWMEYMRTRYMKDYIVTKDKYGDWCVPPESLELIKSKDSTRTTDGQLIATAYYYHLLHNMMLFALATGHMDDVAVYEKLMVKVQEAFQQRFYNSKNKCYDNNTVTANLLPLYFSITPDSLKEGVFNNVYTKIRIDNHMHISTGLIGTQVLLRTLSQFNQSSIAYTLASNKTYPSWGYMAEKGATTIWELWNGNTANPQMNSQNHVMLLGDLLIWLYQNVAGIRITGAQADARTVMLKPDLIDGLDSVSASYQSLYGKVVSSYKYNKTRSRFDWDITIPANNTGLVYVPVTDTSEVTVDGRPVSAVAGVVFLKMQGRYAMYQTGSGSYHFRVSASFKKGILVDQFIFDRAPFPESHASTIVQTPKGLIASWFGGTKEANKDVCIFTSRLENGQWTTPQQVADGIMKDTLRYPCYNPVLYQVPNGELLLFFKIGARVATWKGYMIRSKDHGLTWGPREELPEGFLGPVKNKPIMIGNELWCASSTEGSGWKVHFEVTSDFGKTWRKIGPINDGKTINAIQPSILTYKDGSLQVLCRTRNRMVASSWSKDGGKTWSPMEPSGLPNGNSGTDAVTLKDGRQLIVYNHVKPELPQTKGPRTPLNVAVSKDGKQWMAALVLEDSPVSQYSYPSVIQTPDGMVHIVYTWRRERIKYVKIDPAQLTLTPIVNEQWPGTKNNEGHVTNDD